MTTPDLENKEAADTDNDEDFDAGYKDAHTTTVEKPPEAAKSDMKEEAAVEPEFKVTKKDWDEMRAAAARTASYDQQFSRIYGTIGNIQQTIKKPAAAAEQTTVDPAAKPVVDDDAAIRKRVTDAAVEREIEALEDLHPTWRDVVGVPDAEGKTPDNDFRKWLATQPAEYQQRINATHSSVVISRAIDKFKVDAEAAKVAATVAAAEAAKTNLRKNRLADAVTPRGDGRQTAPGKSDDEEFNSGFKEG